MPARRLLLRSFVLGALMVPAIAAGADAGPRGPFA